MKCTRTRWIRLVLMLSLLGMVSLAQMPEADAAPRIIRPGTRPGAYAFGLGVLAGLNYGGATLTLHNQLGFHLLGDSSGPLLGIDFDLNIGSVLGMTIAGRFAWDIQIAGLGVYVAPFFRAGVALAFSGAVVAAFNMQFGARAKVILNNRLLLFFQPIGIDLNIGNFGGFGRFGGFGGTVAVLAGYQLLFGVGATF